MISSNKVGPYRPGCNPTYRAGRAPTLNHMFLSYPGDSKKVEFCVTGAKLMQVKVADLYGWKKFGASFAKTPNFQRRLVVFVTWSLQVPLWKSSLLVWFLRFQSTEPLYHENFRWAKLLLKNRLKAQVMLKIFVKSWLFSSSQWRNAPGLVQIPDSLSSQQDPAFCQDSHVSRWALPSSQVQTFVVPW